MTSDFLEIPHNLKLCVWDGDWGLPSLDHNCLSVMAYCKFSCIEIDIERTSDPWKFSSGMSKLRKIYDGSIDHLPVLLHHGEKISGAHNITNFLKQRQIYGTDFELSPKEANETIAYTCMIECKLLPALLHLKWIDNASFTEVTKAWYSKTMPFPLNHHMAHAKNRSYKHRVISSHVDEYISPAEREAKIYLDAKDCLNCLSAKLGDKDYFFGNKPTSLDAFVFGHIAPLLKIVSPNTTLSNHLKGCTNLCKMIENILETYFPLSPEEMKAEQKKHQEEETKTMEVTDNNSRQKILVSFLIAFGAMVSYAFFSGLVQIDVGSDDPTDYPFRNTNKYSSYDDSEDNEEEE